MIDIEPTVSVITPLHNAEKFIKETIESVISQSFHNWEMIVVDDESEDDSVAIVKQYMKRDDRVKLIPLRQNSGAAVARNTAIEAAQGRYIAFLDSDDVWLPEKLEKQLAFMQEHNVTFSFSAYERIDENGNHLGRVGVPEKVTYQQMLKTSVVGCLTAIYDTQHFGKVYMPLIRKRQDYGLWLTLLKSVPYGYGIQKSLALYRVHPGSVSSNKLNTAMYNWRLYREIENLSLLKSSYYFCHYAVRGVLRSKFPNFAKKVGSWMNKQTVLVTGASGFVGQQLVTDLVQHDYGVVRQSRHALPEQANCVDVIKSVDSKTDWSDALIGVTHVVHCAARVHMMVDNAENPLDEFREINTYGTINLARQAAEAGVSRFIFLSSIGVNGSYTETVPFSENDIPQPHNAYAMSKWEAEQALMALAKETGMEVVIIRPPLVYGPRVKGNFASMVKWVKRGVPLPFANVHNLRTLVALENLTDFICTCLAHPKAANELFLMGDDEDVSTTDLLHAIAQAYGKKAWLFPIPVSMITATANALGLKAITVRLFGSLQVNSTKARTLLGWQDVITLRAQLAKLAADNSQTR